MLDQSKDLIWIISKDFLLMYGNNAYFSFMKEAAGIEKKLNESVFIKAFGKADTEKWKSYYNRALNGEYFEIEEHHSLTESHEIHYSQTSFLPLLGEDNEVIGVSCQSRDITRIVKHRSETNQLMDTALDVFCSIDEDGNFIHVSAAALTHWGYTTEELLGKPYISFILDEDIPKTIQIAADIINGKDVNVFTNRYKKKDGGIAYNLWSARWDSTSKLMYCVARDGKEKLEQEEILFQSEQYFKALVQEGADLVGILDVEGNYIYVSPTSTNILGIKPEEFIGKNAFEFIHPDDAARVLSCLQRITTEIKITVEPFRFQNHKKEWRWVETVLTNMLKNPSVNGIVSNSRDVTDRINQKEKILQSELRFKALIQGGADVMGIIDAEGNYIYVSPASTEIIGMAPEEFIGRNALEFMHPDDVESCLISLQRIATEKRVELKPFRFLNKNNETRWIETVLTNMMDNPVVNGIVANSRDVTDRIEEQERNKLIHNRFEALVENSMDCIVIISPEGKTTYVSGSVKKILGYTVDEVMNLNIWELCHPDDLEESQAVMALSFENPGVPMPGYVSRIKHKDGSWRWVEPIVTNLLHDPSIMGFVDNFRDITDKVEEQKRLKLFESVVTNTNDAILITEAEPQDEPGPRIIYVNEAFTKMTGYTADEVIGKSPRILQGPNSNKEELAKLGRALRNWESFELTTLNYKKNGEEFWINFSVTPVADDRGWYTQWIAIERDVTEMKMKELEKDLVNEISEIFQQYGVDEFITCLTKISKSIATFGDFDFAEIWLPAIDEKSINLVAQYVKSGLGNDFFEKDKNLNSFKLGEGMPGYVWENKAIEIMERDDEEWYRFKRKVAAEKVSIDTIMGVPLKHKDEFIGVLLIGTTKSKSSLSIFKEIFKKVKLTIGAELSRKKIEIELAQIFNSTPDMICLAGFDGYLKRINPAGLKLMGYSLEEMCSQPIVSFIHEEDKHLTKNKQKGLYTGRNIQNFENRYVTKQGEIVWLSWTATSDLEQKIVYAAAKNITEEKKLRELNRVTRSIAKIGSWEVDLLNNHVYWSDEVHEMHETDPNSFLPELNSAIDFYREDFRDLVATTTEKCIKLGEPFDFEAVIITTKKKELWIRSIGNAEFINGECTRIYGSFQNIQDLKETENRLTSLSDNLPGVVYQYVVHPDGSDSIQNISGMVEQLWGYSVNDVKDNIDLLWNRIRLGGDADLVHESVRKSIETKTKWTSRFKFILPNGELRTHLGNGGIPIFLSDGRVLFNVIILDITQEVKTEKLLTQASHLARIGSWEMDLIKSDGDNMYWSPMIKTIIEVEETFDSNLRVGIDFFIGESKDLIERSLLNLKNEGHEFDEELLLLTAKGNERWVRVIGKSEMANNKRTKIYGSLQDIDDRKKSEIKLAESENRLRTILEAEPECVKLMDEEGKILMMNPAGLAMIEAESETQILNQSVLGIVLPEHRTPFLNLTKNVFRGENAKLIYEIKGLRGTKRWMETHAVPLKSENGEISSILAVTRDITEQKEAQKEIMVSEEKRRLIMSGALDAIICIQPNQEITFWNPQAELLFGWKESEAIGQMLPELIIPEAYRKFHEEGVKKYIQKGSGKMLNKLLELSAIRRNGEEFPIELTIIPIEQDGDVFFCAFIRDLTNRKKAEEEKNNLLSTIENNLNEIYIFNTETLFFSYVNKGALNNLGYSEHEIKGLTPIDIKPGFTEISFRQLSNPLILKEKEKVVFLANHERKDGSVYPVEVHLQIVTDGGNTKFLAVVLDITERKKAEESILQANERFEKVTEATNDVIWDWDIVNKSFYRSKAVEKFFGKDVLKQIKVKDFWKDSFHSEDLDRVQNSIDEAISNPSIYRWESEYRIFNDREEIVYVIDRGIIVRNDDGKAIRMVGAMTDVTEQKEFELQLSELNISLQQHSTELERSNEELEQFAFIASHDLQEPLRMISSFMDQLKRKYEDKLDDKALKYIHFATDGAFRMKQIILDLLDFSRAGKLNEDLDSIDLNEVLDEYKFLRRKIIKEKEVILLSDNLPVIKCFRAPITQALHCLIDNAIKYSKTDINPQIEIRVSENEVEWIIQIKDNGIGIDNNYFDKIFIIFQRLHNKDQYGGTGIGLSIAKKNIESCNGKIWVESVLNEGSEFYFTVNK